MTIVYQRTYYGDLNGKAIDDGSVYIGVANQDPQVNPIDVFWDDALTVPAAQPLAVSAGYVVNAGTRSAVYIAQDSCSIRVLNRAGVQVDYIADANDSSLRSILSGVTGAAQIGKAGSGTVQDFIDDIGGTIAATPVTLEDATDPYTLGQIIAFTGLTPQMMPGFTAGASNHSPYINEAIERLITGGGGTLWLPPIVGDWQLGGSIECHKTGTAGSYLNVKGVGDKVRLEWLGTTGNAFEVGDGTNDVYYVTLENFLLYSSATRTSGTDFRLRKANSVQLRGIRTDGSFNGFHGTDLNNAILDDCEFNLPIVNAGTAAGITVFSDPAGAGRTDNVMIRNTVVQAINAGSYGLIVNGRVNGLVTEWARLLGCRRSLVLDSTGTGAGNIPSFCHFDRLETDRALEISVVINKAFVTEFTGRFDISNTSGALDTPYPQGSADTTAFYNGPGAFGTKLIGGRVGNCRSQAMLDYGDNTIVLGTEFTDMAKNTGASFAGIFVDGDGFSYVAPVINGEARATYAIEFTANAAHGTVDHAKYKGIVTGYATGTGTDVDTGSTSAKAVGW